MIDSLKVRSGSSSVEKAQKVDMEVVWAVLTVVMGGADSCSACNVLGQMALEKPKSGRIVN